MNDAMKAFIKASLIITICLIILYVIGYKKWENQEFDDRIDYSEYMGKPQLQEQKKISEKEAKELYEKINYNFVEENYGKEFLNIYYDNKEFTNEFMIYLAIINIQYDSFRINCNNTVELDKELVDNKIKELFGNDIKYEDTNITTLNKHLIIKYQDEKNKYLVTNNKCSGHTFGTGYIETEFLNYQEVRNVLEITEYVYYIDYQSDINGKYVINYYNSLDNKGTIVAKDTLEQKDKDKFLKYKLIFEKELNDKYVFKKIEILK